MILARLVCIFCQFRGRSLAFQRTVLISVDKNGDHPMSLPQIIPSCALRGVCRDTCGSSLLAPVQHIFSFRRVRSLFVACGTDFFRIRLNGAAVPKPATKAVVPFFIPRSLSGSSSSRLLLVFYSHASVRRTPPHKG